ncbi:hypothetical protein B0T16DRAFT_105119 [Cercophora newfieldiana]|uniref:Uncharacterized protein n=1 Tax=Cercophora newfieldiana TaxID=92897 RepID=A0AA39YHJ3_9PEZI|nr:hypothetical protein B0T16DRAFT_105119 [Cercophora newfieldiana]
MDFTGYPPVPPLGSLRIARYNDVPRLAAIATASYHETPAFAWERRYHAAFPEDTMQEFAKMFADFITDPHFVVVVATGAFDPEEHSKTNATLRPIAIFPPAHPVIVGVAIWQLEPGSCRHGQFSSLASSMNTVYHNGLNRDISPHHGLLLREAIDQVRMGINFDNHQWLQAFAVHPAYRDHGHSGRLLEWGKELARFDQVHQGVLATG